LVLAQLLLQMPVPTMPSFFVYRLLNVCNRGSLHPD